MASQMDHSSSDASINSASSNATDDPAELERLIFSAINDGDRDGLIEILENPSSSTAILQLMLTTSYPNADHFYKHDPEVQQDADELLGQSVENLNAIQIACILGDEEIASDILEFVVRITEEIEARKVLYEFMGRVWGNGNTVLHLASFLGMCELVARLLELGANPNKKNERQYKPVDCTNDNETLLAFNNVTEAPRPPAGSSNHEDFRPRASSVQSVDELLAAPNRSLQQGVISISRPLQNLKRSSSEKLCASSEDYPDEKSPSLTNLCRSGSANSRGLNDTTATPIASTASGTVGAIRRSVGTIRKSRSHTKLTDSADSKPQHQQQEHKASKKVHFNPKTFLFQICQNGESDKSIDPDIPSLAEILHQLETTDRASSESSPSDDTVEQSQQSQQPIINTIFTPYQWLSPLHQACSHGHSSVVKQLLQSKALVNARDKEGWTPLHCACAEGHVEVVRILGQCRGPHSIGLALSASGTDAFGAIYCCPDGPIDLEAVNDDGDTPEGLARDIEDVTRRKEVLDVLKDIKERHAAMSLKDPPDQLGDDQLVPDGDDDDDTWSISDYYVNITLRSLPKPDTQPVRSAMKGSRDSLARSEEWSADHNKYRLEPESEPKSLPSVSRANNESPRKPSAKSAPSEIPAPAANIALNATSAINSTSATNAASKMPIIATLTAAAASAPGLSSDASAKYPDTTKHTVPTTSATIKSSSPNAASVLPVARDPTRPTSPIAEAKPQIKAEPTTSASESAASQPLQQMHPESVGQLPNTSNPPIDSKNTRRIGLPTDGQVLYQSVLPATLSSSEALRERSYGPNPVECSGSSQDPVSVEHRAYPNKVEEIFGASSIKESSVGPSSLSKPRLDQSPKLEPVSSAVNSTAAAKQIAHPPESSILSFPRQEHPASGSAQVQEPVHPSIAQATEAALVVGALAVVSEQIDSKERQAKPVSPAQAARNPQPNTKRFSSQGSMSLRGEPTTSSTWSPASTEPSHGQDGPAKMVAPQSIDTTVSSMGSQPTLNDSGQAPHSPRASVRKAVRQRPLSRTFEPNPQLAAIGSESPTDSAASSPSDNSGIRDKIAHVESKIRGSGEAPSPNTSRPGKPVLKSLAKGFGSIASSVKPFLSRDKSGSKENLQISTTSQPPSSTETQLCGSPVIGGATVHRRDGGRAPEPLARSNDAPPSPAADTSGTPNPKGTYGPRSKRRTSGGYGVGETVSGDFTWLRNPSVSSPATTKSLECLMSKDEAETGIPDSGSSAEGTPIDEEQNKRRLKRMSGMSRSPSVRERISRLEQVGDKSGCPTPPPLPKPSDGASVDSAKSSRKQPTLRGNR